jgi:hypothetical protein
MEIENLVQEWPCGDDDDEVAFFSGARSVEDVG